MKRGRRKIENPEIARRILAAAEKHFAEEGMAGARTDEIAAEARANKAMLYYYFGNKESLHQAVLENLFRQLFNGSNGTNKDSSSAVERLRHFVSGYFDFLVAHPNYPRLMQREAMNASANFRRIAREYMRPFHERLVKTIRDGIKAGEIRQVDADNTAFSILHMTTGYFAAAPIMSKVVGRNLLTPQAVEARKRALFDFMEHGLRPEGVNPR
jgi:TetR/AcrR family transcriptional regulator